MTGFAYSAQSKARLDTARVKLRGLFEQIVQYFDVTILYGHRTKAEQDDAVARGVSQKPWPTSPHNDLPSRAVDAAPYYGGIDWRTDAELLKAAKEGRWEDFRVITENIKRWYHFGGFVRGYGAAVGAKVRWGGDWDGDFKFNDHTLVDLPHFEEEE